MKTKLVPFDLEKAQAGAKVVTRCGYPVRIDFYDVKNEIYPILAIVQDGESEFPYRFTINGKYHKSENIDSSYDLFIEEEVENDSKNQDEAIRKALISYFQSFPFNSLEDAGINAKDAIAWLEKQGEQETLCDKCKKSQPSHSCQDITALGRCAVEHEQKPADNKPKFQEGDWVIFHPGCNAHQILRVVENATSHTYGYDTVDNYYFNDTAEGVRLWNINDAKDGDVLAIDWKDNEHGYNWQKIVIFKSLNKFGVEGYGNTFKNNILIFEDEVPYYSKTWSRFLHPATEEQRDILFQKMKEAGYEWNFDKKELKKIEKVKKRRMTHQELSWWLRDCPEEHREYGFCDDEGVRYFHTYRKDSADKEVEKEYRIRRNGGEWEEPLIEE